MSLFGKSIVKEIGRNVGKGISNDLFGDWHATPVRASISQSKSKGFDLGYVAPEEYDVSEQPFYKEGGIFEALMYGIFGTLFILPMPILWYQVIASLIRSKTNLFARVPARKKDGRTKAGYKEYGYHFIKLKSKRLLNDEEKSYSKKFALALVIGQVIAIVGVFWLTDYFDAIEATEAS